jgi:1-acyl-sn-glycerol-3-phosphate acyltransferase
MKATPMMTLWLGAKIIFFTMACASCGFISGLARTTSRERVNQWLRTWAQKLLRAVQATLTIRGMAHLYPLINTDNPKPIILMSNHVSHYDIPAIYASIPLSIRMIGKKELFRIPIFGQGARYSDFISIDRGHSEKAMQSLKAARQKMESGIVIWVAPEGTRSNHGELLPFKKGVFILAIETGATIVPIGLQGTRAILPARTFDLSLNQSITVSIGAPIDASDYTVEDKMALLERTRMAIEQLIQDEHA